MAKQVTDRQGAMEAVVSAAETHANRIAKAFEEIFGDSGEGRDAEDAAKAGEKSEENDG